MSSFIIIIVYFVPLLNVVLSAEEELPLRYDDYSVWEATPTDQNGLQYIQNLLINGSDDFKVDFWQFPKDINNPAEIMINNASLSQLKNEFVSRKVELKLLIDNVQKLIDNEKSTVRNVTFKFLPGVKPTKPTLSDSSGYPTLEEINNFLSQLPEKYPNLAERIEIATSHEKRKISLIKITNKQTNGLLQKPAIWIDAGIHAREWITPVTALYAITRLLTEYNSPGNNSNLYVDNLIWYIMPVMNPDGYSYTHTKDRMWRKNRRPKMCNMAKLCCEGVDLNRNFDYKWSEPGASASPCTEVYHGPSAFSEPETKGVKDFILANKNFIKAYITLHSFGQLWMYPFGSSPLTYSSDVKDLIKLAEKATNALQSTHGTKYTVGSPADLMYSASGLSMDWAKAVANVKFAYTLELRPQSGRGSFILPANQIMPTSVETWNALQVIGQEIFTLYSFANDINEE